jgi:hypothetical protein
VRFAFVVEASIDKFEQEIKFKISNGSEPPIDPGDVVQVKFIFLEAGEADNLTGGTWFLLGSIGFVCHCQLSGARRSRDWSAKVQIFLLAK